MDTVRRVEAIIGRKDEDGLIESLVFNIQDAVNLYCGTLSVPEQLRFVVIEATVSRYNRLGAEGFKSENIDIISQTYIEDVLEPYKKYMDSYKNSNGLSTVSKATFV